MDFLENLEADLARALTQVENGVISSRVAEKANIDAVAAIEHIRHLIKQQRRVQADQRPAPAADWTTAMGVSKKKTAQILGVSERTVSRLIQRGGPLETYTTGRARLITTRSILKLQEGARPPKPVAA